MLGPKVSQHLLGLPDWILRLGTGGQVCLRETRQCDMILLTALYLQARSVKDWKEFAETWMMLLAIISCQTD